MHVLIIEFALSGHHPGYLERLARTFLEDGKDVTVTVLKRDACHPVITKLETEFRQTFAVFPIDGKKYSDALNSRWRELGRELALRRLMGSVYQSISHAKRVDYVFLPYLDYCLYAIGLRGAPFGATPWGAICMRPSFHYRRYEVIAPKPRFSQLKQILFMRLFRSKTLRRIYTIDPLLLRFIEDNHHADRAQIQYLADPAELHGNASSESARRAFGIPSDAIVILVYGAIDERKGMDHLLSALGHRDIPATVHVLVVGHQSPSMKVRLGGSDVLHLVEQRRYHAIDEFVDAAVEQMAFSASDVVWLGYNSHYGMSGVLVLAALSGLPVIATRNGLIGWYTRTRSLGASIDTEDLPQVVCAIRDLTGSRMLGRLPNEEIRAIHSWTAFSQAVGAFAA